jgi:hypothetical protein
LVCEFDSAEWRRMNYLLSDEQSLKFVKIG